jgi:hypothetical protein
LLTGRVEHSCGRIRSDARYDMNDVTKIFFQKGESLV